MHPAGLHEEPLAVSGQRWQLLNEWARGGSWEAAQGPCPGPREFPGCQDKEVAAGRGKVPHCLPEQGEGSMHENHRPGLYF